MKSQGYMTRALKARDPRFARVLGRLGYEGAPVEAPVKKASKKAEGTKAVPKQDERTMLRAEYERVVGKRPFVGWDVAELRHKIADATKAPNEGKDTVHISELDADAAKAAAAGDTEVAKIATVDGPDDAKAAELANAKPENAAQPETAGTVTNVATATATGPKVTGKKAGK